MLFRSPKFDLFNSKFEIGDDILSDMRNAADKENIVFDKKQYELSLPLIKVQLKALVARDLWNMDEYFQIMNQANNSVVKALEVLNSGRYQKLLK